MRLEIGHAQQDKTNNSAIYEIAGESSRSEAATALREGIRAAQSGDRTRARTFLLRASELDPSSESAWLWLASISEYPEELLVFLNNVLDINPRNARANEWMRATKTLLAKTFVQRGIDAMSEGREEHALQFFNQALENDQANPTAWLWLARLCDSEEGRMNYLEKALELDPENEEARNEHASLKRKLNQALLAEAKAAAVAGRKSDANELLDAFIAEYPDSEDGWMLRAHLADAFDQKIAAFEKVLSINPQNLAARSGIDSLREIMKTVMPAHSELAEDSESALKDEAAAQSEADIEAMENIAFAIDREREFVDSIVQDKNPTQELIFPEAALEMAHGVPESASPVNVDVFTDEPIYFDDPAIIVSEEDPRGSDEWKQTAPDANQNQLPENDSESLDWSMNTVAFSFSFPAGEAKGDDAGDSADLSSATGTRLPEDLELRVKDSLPDFDFRSSLAAPSWDDDRSNLTEIFDADSTEINSSTATNNTSMKPQPVGPASDSKKDEVVSPFTEKASSDFSSSLEASPVRDEPQLFEFAVSPIENANNQSAWLNDAAVPESLEEIAHAPDAELSVPVPMDFGLPSTFPLAPESPSPTHGESRSADIQIAECPFCKAKNPGPVFTCNSCLAILTLSDLEMLLGNNHADRLLIRGAIEDLESVRNQRELTEAELTNLGIAYLNLKEFQQGFLCLQEAARKNPDNVLLSGQVNALLIRLEEISQQEVVRDSGLKAHSVLVIDDSATVRKLIVGKLEKSGYEVFAASDGIQALEMLKTISPDLILLDITMPGMDGYQVCKVIRGMESTKDTPVIMISGKDGFFDKVRGRMAGTTGYITKPFGPETLMKAVESHLNGSQE